MKDINNEFGRHYLVELINCDSSKLMYLKDVKKVFLDAAKKSKANIIDSHFFQFDPVGVTGGIFIRESHLSVHTWPEDRYAAFDIFTCGEMDCEVAIEVVRLGFCAERIIKKVIRRGF